MSLIRKRYYIWLIKAYVRRWYKTIVTSVVLGGVAFFVSAFVLSFYLLPLIQKKVQKIGYFGIYTSDKIPIEILGDVSYGLTSVDDNGKINPGAAYRWQIKNDGRQYTFFIKKGQYFHDNKELTAKSLNFNFKEAKEKIIDDYTISFTLKEAYAPFLSSVSKPILSKNFSGLGNYKIKKIELNGGFVKSITLQNKKNSSYKKIIIFYPTQEVLKSAFMLGEVDIAQNLNSHKLNMTDFASWHNTKITKKTNYGELVSIFYNNSDKNLSNKKIRQALNYALPQVFEEGERAYSPIKPTSIYFSKTPNYGISNMEIAKSLIAGDRDIKKTTFEISVLEGYDHVAKLVASQWEKIGIKVKTKNVNELPRNFQILIYPISLPADPDQYTLWHSSQINNISKYKNLRIDKLLEDGRSTTDIEKRVAIYSDFQKYLIDDVPASFLYFPYQYTLIRE